MLAVCSGMEVLPLALKTNDAASKKDDKLIPVVQVRYMRAKVELAPEWKSRGRYNQNTIYEPGSFFL